MELNNMKMSSPETIFKLPELHKEVFQEFFEQIGQNPSKTFVIVDNFFFMEGRYNKFMTEWNVRFLKTGRKWIVIFFRRIFSGGNK